MSAVSMHSELGCKGGIIECSKIDVVCNVLQARIYEWLIMGMMTKMTHERALMPLWVIVLMLGKAIVNEQGRTGVQPRSERADPGFGLQIHLADIAGEIR